jgi:hypothetical protein
MAAWLARLESLQALPTRPSMGDLPRWAWLTRVRVIGPLVAYLREFYTSLYIHAQVRAPWYQQIFFNTETTRFVRQLWVRVIALRESHQAQQAEQHARAREWEDRFYAAQIALNEQLQWLRETQTHVRAVMQAHEHTQAALRDTRLELATMTTAHEHTQAALRDIRLELARLIELSAQTQPALREAHISQQHLSALSQTVTYLQDDLNLLIAAVGTAAPSERVA